MISAPLLDGQIGAYLFKQLKDYQDGRRSNDLMNGLVRGLSDQDLADIATYFSPLKAPPSARSTVNQMAEVLVHRGDPRRILPPTMSGMAEVKKSMCQRFVAKVRPILKRPSRTTRVGTDTMTFLVGCGLYSQELSEKEIKALAEYYGQQRVMRRKPIALSECHAGIVGCFGEWLDGDQFPKHDQNVPDLGIGHL